MILARLVYVSIILMHSLFRDGNGNFEFTIVMYHPDNGQRSYKPLTKLHQDMVVECWDKQCVVRGWMVSNIHLVILNVKLQRCAA